MEIINLAQFLERVKNKQSVSRFDFTLSFEWTAENSKKLQSADLQYADLRYADLWYANLQYADLWYANLQHADLQYANLQYADLKDVRFSEMSFILRCGLSLPSLWLSLKNASQDFKNYLYVQNMAHTAPEKVMAALNAQVKTPKKIKVKNVKK